MKSNEKSSEMQVVTKMVKIRQNCQISQADSSNP